MLRQIRYFQAVVRNNSFSEAAEECHISQSAISQQIKALEGELGFALLEQKNRKFVLPPRGNTFTGKVWFWWPITTRCAGSPPASPAGRMPF